MALMSESPLHVAKKENKTQYADPCLLSRSAALDVVSQAESAVEEGSLEESYLVSM